MKAIIVPVTAATLLLMACGNGGASATCSPSGTELHIAARPQNAKLREPAVTTSYAKALPRTVNVPPGAHGGSGGQFNTDCLAAPAGEPFTIEFDNQDTSPLGNHNVHIFNGGDLFVGDIINHGTSITYEVGAIEAGTYQFQCDVHPVMNGAFIVK